MNNRFQSNILIDKHPTHCLSELTTTQTNLARIIAKDDDFSLQLGKYHGYDTVTLTGEDVSRERLVLRTAAIIKLLQDNGFTVERYQILEDLWDSSFDGDACHLLGGV